MTNDEARMMTDEPSLRRLLVSLVELRSAAHLRPRSVSSAPLWLFFWRVILESTAVPPNNPGGK